MKAILMVVGTIVVAIAVFFLWVYGAAADRKEECLDAFDRYSEAYIKGEVGYDDQPSILRENWCADVVIDASLEGE